MTGGITAMVADQDLLGVVTPDTQVWLGGNYFTVVGSPTTVYERSADEAVDRVRALLGATISLQAPNEVEVSRPSDALAARTPPTAALSS